MEQPPYRFLGLNKFRRHSRVHVPAPFSCALSRFRAHHWLRRPRIDVGVVYDLSICGARVSTDAEMRPGDEITLSFRLPRQIKPAEIAIATVQWTKDQFFGLAFTELSPAAKSRLEKYVAVVSTSAE